MPGHLPSALCFNSLVIVEKTIKVVIFHAGWLRWMRNTWGGSFALSPVLWHGESYLCFISFHFCFCKMRPIHRINSVTVSRERDEIENESWYISPQKIIWLLTPCKFIHSHNVFKWHSKHFTLTWPYFSIFTVHYIFPGTLQSCLFLKDNIHSLSFSMPVSMLFLLSGTVSSLSLPKFCSSCKTMYLLMNLLSAALTGHHLTSLLRRTDLFLSLHQDYFLLFWAGAGCVWSEIPFGMQNTQERFTC